MNESTYSSINERVPSFPLSGAVPYAKATRTINRPVYEVFPLIVEADLPTIFPAEGGAPGVVSTTLASGWNRPGLKRQNTLSDGSHVKEELLSVVPNVTFSYRIFDFTADALQALSEIYGTWTFTDNDGATTSIEWIYALVPKPGVAPSEVEHRLLPLYRARLERALEILKQQIEAGSEQRAPR